MVPDHAPTELSVSKDERRWYRNRAEPERATRANVQLAMRSRDAGLSAAADHFAYRAQVCRRGVHQLRCRLLCWPSSRLLFVVAGYGQRPLRTLFWYAANILGVAVPYIGFGRINGRPFAFDEALAFRVTSFHGRGLYPGTRSPKDLVTQLVAAGAVLGRVHRGQRHRGVHPAVVREVAQRQADNEKQVGGSPR